MQLEHGKYYKNRKGTIVQVALLQADALYPFVAMHPEKEAGCRYMQDGRYTEDYDTPANVYDLVEEVVEVFERPERIMEKRDRDDAEKLESVMSQLESLEEAIAHERSELIQVTITKLEKTNDRKHLQAILQSVAEAIERINMHRRSAMGSPEEGSDEAAIQDQDKRNLLTILGKDKKGS